MEILNNKREQKRQQEMWFVGDCVGCFDVVGRLHFWHPDSSGHWTLAMYGQPEQSLANAGAEASRGEWASARGSLVYFCGVTSICPVKWLKGRNAGCKRNWALICSGSPAVVWNHLVCRYLFHVIRLSVEWLCKIYGSELERVRVCGDGSDGQWGGGTEMLLRRQWSMPALIELCSLLSSPS